MKYSVKLRAVSVLCKASLLMMTASSLSPAHAQEYVHGYTRSNGTYVAPYYRSEPDGSVANNYSYEGNVNPFTGETGTNRYTHDETSPYYEGPDSDGDSGHDGGNDGDN